MAMLAMFSALMVGAGWALALVPNIEFVSLLAFVAGATLGMAKGALVGAIGMFLFSATNPVGSGLAFPLLLGSQILAMLVLLLLSTAPAFPQGAGIEWEALNQEVTSLQQKGQYDRAVAVARKALELAEKNVGPEQAGISVGITEKAGKSCPRHCGISLIHNRKQPAP